MKYLRTSISIQKKKYVAASIYFFISAFLHTSSLSAICCHRRSFLVFVIPPVSEIDRDKCGGKYARMDANRFAANIHLKKKKWSRTRSRHSDMGVRSPCLHSPFLVRNGTKIARRARWTKMGRFNLRPPRKVPPSYRSLLARARARPIHIDFALVVVYRRREFSWPPHSLGESARRKEEVRRRRRESTEDLINGGVILRTTVRKNLPKKRNWKGGGRIKFSSAKRIIQFSGETHIFFSLWQTRNNSAVTRGKENTGLSGR